MMKQGKKNDPPSQISDVALYVLVLLLLAFQIAVAYQLVSVWVWLVWQPKAMQFALCIVVVELFLQFLCWWPGA
jgi:hypothetical protein